uniref:Adrenodoxin-like protein n=1 Tax=Salmo trutta TaxID=8032 RepID=A0A673Y3T0_SALTR
MENVLCMNQSTGIRAYHNFLVVQLFCSLSLVCRVKVVYIAHSGQRIPVKAHVEDNILYPSHMYRLKCAYESSWACSTCHVMTCWIWPLCSRRTRLRCQIILTPELDGIGVTLPKVTRNFYVDGHMPAHH